MGYIVFFSFDAKFEFHFIFYYCDGDLATIDAVIKLIMHKKYAIPMLLQISGIHSHLSQFRTKSEYNRFRDVTELVEIWTM